MARFLLLWPRIGLSCSFDEAHPDHSSHKKDKRQLTSYQRSNQWRTQEFCSGGGVQQIQLKTEDRENGDLGAAAL